MIYFGSDHHFGHANNLKYSRRLKFCNDNERKIIETGTEEEINDLTISIESVQRHNISLINEHNKIVKSEDTYYCLGDFAFYNSKACEHKGEGIWKKPNEYITQLNGQKIFVMGNHDFGNKLKCYNHRIVIYIGKMFVNLCHDPAHGNMDYELNLHGHVHNQWKVKVIERDNKKALFVNVGVDQWKYRPVSWNKIHQIYAQWKAGQDVEKIYNKTA